MLKQYYLPSHSGLAEFWSYCPSSPLSSIQTPDETSANVALPDVTFQHHFQCDWLKVPGSVWDSTQRLKDEHKIKSQPHFSLSKVRLNSISFQHVLTFIPQGENISLWDSLQSLGDAVTSLWLIQKDNVKIVCTQFQRFCSHINTCSYYLWNAACIFKPHWNTGCSLITNTCCAAKHYSKPTEHFFSV